MTNKKNTRRALFLSVISLMLCCAMLVGTTFAWFTDSAISGNNVINSGNLDIAVTYTLDGKTWKEFDGAEDLFQTDCWEPGHTEVVALKVENKGSLYLKYNANMNIVQETAGQNMADGEIVLSDILTVSTLIQQSSAVGDITVGLAFAGENSIAYENTAPFKSSNVLRKDVELAPGDAHYVIVKVDMAETVGNEANHDGEHVPVITFGMNVLATQFTHGNDTFGNEYDQGSLYPVATADELVEALESNKSVVLGNDIKIEPAKMSNAYGKTGINVKNGQTIDGANHTLDIKDAGGTWDSGINTTGGLIKNIKVTGSFRGIFINHNSSYSEKVVLEDVIISGTTYTISCDQGLYQDLEATNCTFNGWTSYAETIGIVKFVDCNFGAGSGYKFCRPYAPTEFVGCDFCEGYKVDPCAAVTFENCTINGDALTADNLATLVTSNFANASVK